MVRACRFLPRPAGGRGPTGRAAAATRAGFAGGSAARRSTPAAYPRRRTNPAVLGVCAQPPYPQHRERAGRRARTAAVPLGGSSATRAAGAFARAPDAPRPQRGGGGPCRGDVAESWYARRSRPPARGLLPVRDLPYATDAAATARSWSGKGAATAWPRPSCSPPGSRDWGCAPARCAGSTCCTISRPRSRCCRQPPGRAHRAGGRPGRGVGAGRRDPRSRAGRQAAWPWSSTGTAGARPPRPTARRAPCGVRGIPGRSRAWPYCRTRTCRLATAPRSTPGWTGCAPARQPRRGRRARLPTGGAAPPAA